MELSDHEVHVEHDVWHVDLAIWLGAPSHALMAAMGVELWPRQQALADLEEAVVIALQHYAKAAGVGLPRGSKPTPKVSSAL